MTILIFERYTNLLVNKALNPDGTRFQLKMCEKVTQKTGQFFCLHKVGVQTKSPLHHLHFNVSLEHAGFEHLAKRG